MHRVAKIGGAQAIAALAYGTDSIPRVNKIFGPGNRYVAAAKQIVSSDCAIDMLAGPTEALIFAVNGNAKFIAADLIAQAEHDPDAISIFVTTSGKMAQAVAAKSIDSSSRFRQRIRSSFAGSERSGLASAERESRRSIHK